MSARAIYPPNDSVQERIRQAAQVSRITQDARNRADMHDALLKQRKQLLDRGIPEEHLPNISTSMSPVDLVKAQETLNKMGATSGTTGAVLNGNIRVGQNGLGANTGTPLPRPAGSATPATPTLANPTADPTAPMMLGGTAQPDALQRSLVRTVDNAKLPPPVSIPTGDPEARAFNGRSSTPEPGPAPYRPIFDAAPDPTAVAAAGTGKVIQTPYGTASSTVAKPGTLAPAVITDTGVFRNQAAFDAQNAPKTPAAPVATATEPPDPIMAPTTPAGVLQTTPSRTSLLTSKTPAVAATPTPSAPLEQPSADIVKLQNMRAADMATAAQKLAPVQTPADLGVAPGTLSVFRSKPPTNNLAVVDPAAKNPLPMFATNPEDAEYKKRLITNPSNMPGQ